MTIDIGFERFVLLLGEVVLLGYMELAGEFTIRLVLLCVLILIPYPLAFAFREWCGAQT